MPGPSLPNHLTSGRLGPLFTLFYRFGPPRWSHYVLRHWAGQRLVIAAPYLWLLLFFLVPFLIVLMISFSEAQIAMPPYAPLLQWAGLAALGMTGALLRLWRPDPRGGERARVHP